MNYENYLKWKYYINYKIAFQLTLKHEKNDFKV